MRHVPVKIATAPGNARKRIQEVTARRRLLLADAVHADAPVMIEGDVNSRILYRLADRLMSDAYRLLVLRSHLFQARQAHVVPQPVRVHFIANDPAPHAAMGRLPPAPAITQKLHYRPEPAGALRGNGIEGSNAVLAIGTRMRMQQNRILGLVLCRVGQNDRINHHASI